MNTTSRTAGSKVNPLCKFSGGGLVGGAIDAIKKRQSALDAADSADSPNAIVQANPSSAGVKPSMGAQADDYAAQAARLEAEQLAQAKAKLTQPKKKGFFGFANGGKIEGEGTPTSDSIRATVKETGEPIDVSTEERILSKKQDDYLEQLARDLGYDNLEQMLEAGTGEPVGPTIKDGEQAAAYGGKPQDMTYEDVTTSPIGQAPKPVATPVQPAPKPVDQYGNDMTATNKMRTQLGEAPIGVNPLAAKSPVATAASMMPPTKTINQERDYSIPADQQRDAQAAIATLPARTPESAPEQTAAKPINPITQFQNPDFSLIGADRKGYESARQKIAPEAPTASQAVEQARNPLLAVPAAIGQKTFGVDYATTPKPGTVTTDAPLGNSPVNPLVRANPANSFSESGTKMDATNPLTTINMQANNDSMAKANAIRQSTGEGDGPKVSMLGDSGRAESKALMDKWGREDQVREMMQEIGRNPKAAGAIAHLMQTQQGSETARAGMESNQGIATLENDTRRRGQDVVMRGQDIEAETRANQLAGNPLDNAMKQTQVDLGRQAVAKGQEYEKMAADIRAETDPAKRQSMIESLLATQGKNPAENRYVKVDGGEEIGPDGMTKIRRPSGVFDSVTKQFIPMTPNAQSFTKADVDKAISSGADRKAVAERIKQMGGNPADYGLV